MRRFIFIILVLGYVGFLYYFGSAEPRDAAGNPGPSVMQKTISNVVNLVKKTSAVSSDTTTAAPPTNTESPDGGEVSLQKLQPKELQLWIESQAPEMNSTRNNTEEQQVKLQAQAQTLTPVQMQQLVSLSLDIRQPVNSRILSAYMLSLNQSPEAVDQIYELAKSPLPNHGPSVPHSEAELKNTQELALRYMEIDELAKRARTDANAMNKLRLLAQEADGSQVRNYAARKLKDL